MTAGRAADVGLERTLTADFYRSDEIYRRECERIFYAEWVCVGRVEQLENPGDAIVCTVAGESVFVVRTKPGDLRAHYNVCRHRGAQLVRVPAEGAAPCAAGIGGAVHCPYHDWTYGLDGRLLGAPYLARDLDRELLPLHAVGVETWGGFVFLHLTPDAAGPLADQLGAVPQRLERFPLADLRSAKRITYDIAANWKVMLENYNECYHCGPVHPELCEIVPAFKQGGGADLDWEHGIPQREGTTTFTRTGTTTRAPFPGLTEDDRSRHRGELVYPNFMLSLSSDHVAAFTLWPLGPERTVIACDFLFHPDEIAKPEFDPSDAVEFWDLVNGQDWAICESVQRGMRSRVFRQGYYAPMEDQSLDIRRYISERLGS